MKRIVVLLVAVMAIAGFVKASQTASAGGGGNYACQGDRKVTETYDGPALEVTVRDSCFGPNIARIAPGTELRWVNRGQQPHNIVDVSQQAQVMTLQPGATVTMSFARAGAFVYYCAYHPGMTGAVFAGDSLADGNPDNVPTQSLASAAPSEEGSAPRVATAQLPYPNAGGTSTLTVVLLALAIGTVAGGGSTLLTRRLDRR